MNTVNIKVLYCVFTILSLTTFTCPQNNGLNKNMKLQKMTYNGSQVLRVTTMKSKEIAKQIIDKMRKNHLIDVWLNKSISVDMMVKKEHLDIVKSALNNQSLTFKILIEDIERIIDKQRPLNKCERSAKQGINLTFDSYHELHVIYEYIDHLSLEYSDFVEVETIGKSFEGVPLKVVKIRADKNVQTRNTVWIDGGIHAREWITVSSVLYVIDRLVRERDSLEAHMKDTEFHILPIINPDGYKYSHQTDRLWRKNRNTKMTIPWICVGTDLNRNFDFHWDGNYSSSDPCEQIYRGPEAASEPETRALVEYVVSGRHIFNRSLSFHSYGQKILLPWAHTQKRLEDYAELYREGKRMAAAIKDATSTMYKVGTAPYLMRYISTGTSLDWMKGVANIKYSFIVELRDKGNYGFLLPPSEIIPTGKEAFAAVSSLARDIPMDPVDLDINATRSKY